MYKKYFIAVKSIRNIWFILAHVLNLEFLVTIRQFISCVTAALDSHQITMFGTRWPIPEEYSERFYFFEISKIFQNFIELTDKYIQHAGSLQGHDVSHFCIL